MLDMINKAINECMSEIEVQISSFLPHFLMLLFSVGSQSLNFFAWRLVELSGDMIHGIPDIM